MGDFFSIDRVRFKLALKSGDFRRKWILGERLFSIDRN